MKIEYKNNLADFFHFNIFIIPRSRIYQIMGLLLFVILMFLQSRVDCPFFLGTRLSVIFFVVISPFIIAFLLLIISGTLWSALNKRAFDGKSIQFLDEGVVTATKGVKSEVEWSFFTKVCLTRRFILLFIKDNLAIPIPRRDFASEDEAKEIYEFAESRIASANKGG